MIKYWYDESERKLIILHQPSQERREITHLKKIERFLETYQITLEECKQVQEDQDRLGLFKKMRILDR